MRREDKRIKSLITITARQMNLFKTNKSRTSNPSAGLRNMEVNIIKEK
jgi:hypothetical protein